MPDRILRYKNKIVKKNNDNNSPSANALNALIHENDLRREDLCHSVMASLDNAIRAFNNNDGQPVYWINQGVGYINDFMHDLTKDYVIGVIPKEYYMGLLYQLNILKDNLKNFKYDDPRADIHYDKWEENWPSLFVNNEEGDFEKLKTIEIRRDGGLRVHLNPLTDEMLAMLPKNTVDMYKQGFIVEEKDKVKDENNNVIDEDFNFQFNGNYDYRYPLNIKYRKMTDAEFKALEEKIDLTSTKGEIKNFVNFTMVRFNRKLFKDNAEKQEFDKVFDNIHIQNDSQRISLFMLWAMSEKNMSFEDASKIMEGDGPSQEDVDAFKSFCKDNQVLNQKDSPEKFKEKIEKWSAFMVKAMDKIKEFQIPDIDYNDKNKVTEKYKEFFLLSQMGLVITKELLNGIILLQSCKEFSGRSIAVDAMGGEKQFMKTIGFWRDIQSMMVHFSDAFDRSNLKDQIENANNPNEVIKEEIRQSQANFYRFGQIMNEYKGQTLGEAVDKISFDYKINEEIHDNIVFEKIGEIHDDDLFDYAEGTNTQPFTEQMQGFYQAQDDSILKNISYELANKSYSLVTNAYHNKQQADAILTSPNSAEGTIAFLKQKDANGKCYGEYIKDFFGRYNSDLSIKSLLDLNINISGLFIIEGKSAEELWGEKYKNVQNPDEKELLYRTEIYRAMLRQETDIKVKLYELENNKLKEAGAVTVLPGRAKVERILNNFEMYKEVATGLHNKLDLYYNLLESHKEVNEEYLRMHDSLKKVVDAFGNLGKRSEVKLNEALANLQQFKTDFVAYRTMVENAGENAFRLNLDNENTPEEADLQEAIDLMSGFVKNMSSDIMTGNNKNITSNEPVPKYLNYLKQNYDNFTSKYHESKLFKNKEEIQQHISELKDEIKNKAKFPEVRAKVINKQDLTPEDLIVFNTSVRYFTTNARISEFKRPLEQKLVPPVGNPNRDRYINIFKRVPFAGDRGDTMDGLFMLWNMGHNGMSFRDTLELIKSDKVDASIEKFVTFCEENYLKENPDPKKGKEAAVAWAKIMQNATDRMKEYSISDIDFNDPKSIEDHLEEIAMARSLSINFPQEFLKRVCSADISAGVDADNNVYGVKNGQEYLADTLGGKDNLARMLQYWKNLQNPFGLINGAYADFDEATLISWQDGNIKDIIPDIVKFAAQEVYGKYIINKNKDIHNISPVDFYRSADAFTRIQELSVDLRMQKVDVKPEVVIDYLTGANRKPFEDFIVAEIERRTAKTFDKDMWGSAGNELIKNLVKIKPQTAQALVAANSAEEIQNFVDQVSEDRDTNYKLIDICFNDFFSSERVMMADTLNLSIFDLIKVGDKTANELWGEKYNHLDGNKKQSCMCAEILKAILTGDKEVTHQSFKVENGEIKLGKTYLVAPTKQATRDMHDSLLMFDGLRQQITLKLMDYVAKLKSTHPENDRNANFESHSRTGSQPYQDMCFELSRCLYVLSPAQGGSFSIPRFKAALKNLQAVAETYYVRGKTSNPARMEVAEAASREINAYLGILDNITKNCDKNFFTSEGDFINFKPNTMSTMALQRRNVIQKIETQDRPMTPDRQKEVIDCNLARNEYKYNLKRKVGKLPDTSVATNKFSTAEMAKLYVFNQYIDAVNKLEDKNENTEYIKDMGNSFDKSVFEDTVNSIKDNKVFQLVVKKYQAKSVKKWNDIIKKANDIVDECERFLDSKNAAEHAEHVLDPTVKLSAKKDFKMSSKYDRLGEIVANQIIVNANNDNGTVAQAIAAGFIEYKDVVKACTQSLENDRVLDKDDMNIEKLAGQIKDKEYMSSVMYKIAGSFRKSVERKARQPEAQQAQNAQNPQNQQNAPIHNAPIA